MTFRRIIWWIFVSIVCGFSFLYPVFVKPPVIVPEPPIQADETHVPIPDFSQYDKVVDKKVAFFDYLRPEVERQNDYIMSLRLQLQALYNEYQTTGAIAPNDEKRLAWLVSEYRVDEGLTTEEKFKLLLRRIDVIPVDLVLVQAANESAWGTSRFAREGYNLYGLWCFRRGCGFVPKRRNTGAAHEVAKFPNLAHATYTYMRNLNRHDAYKALRDIRRRLRQTQQPITGIALSEGLMQYSERGEDYIIELQQMIRVNQEYISS